MKFEIINCGEFIFSGGSGGAGINPYPKKERPMMNEDNFNSLINTNEMLTKQNNEFAREIENLKQNLKYKEESYNKLHERERELESMIDKLKENHRFNAEDIKSIESLFDEINDFLDKISDKSDDISNILRKAKFGHFRSIFS